MIITSVRREVFFLASIIDLELGSVNGFYFEYHKLILKKRLKELDICVEAKCELKEQ